MKNDRFGKEQHLPNPQKCGFHVSFQGCNCLLVGVFFEDDSFQTFHGLLHLCLGEMKVVHEWQCHCISQW